MTCSVSLSSCLGDQDWDPDILVLWQGAVAALPPQSPTCGLPATSTCFTAKSKQSPSTVHLGGPELLTYFSPPQCPRLLHGDWN